MLNVLTPAASTALGSRAAFRARYGVSSADDGLIDVLIAQASSRISGYCRRAFGKAHYRQIVRPSYDGVAYRDPLIAGVGGWEPEPLILEACGPVLSIEHLSAQGFLGLLAEGVDFERDGYRLFRLSNDMRVAWTARKIVIDYTAGYLLPGDSADAAVPCLPESVSGACLELVFRSHASIGRDPAIAREAIVGVSQIDFAAFGAATVGGVKGGLPADIAAMLDPFVFVTVA